MKYALRRLLHGVVLLVGISMASFVFADLAPGDYFSTLEQDGRVSRELIGGLRSEAGLDRPLPVRYAAWLASVVRGNFGYSLAYRTAAGPLIRERIGGTLLLTGTATICAWLLAIPLGIYHARRRGSWQDHALKLAAAILLATPELLLAIVCSCSRCRPAGCPREECTRPVGSR